MRPSTAVTKRVSKNIGKKTLTTSRSNTQSFVTMEKAFRFEFELTLKVDLIKKKIIKVI